MKMITNRLKGAPKRTFTAQEFNIHLGNVINRSSKKEHSQKQVQYGFKHNGVELENYSLIGYVKGDKVNRPNHLTLVNFDCLQFHRFDGNTIDKKQFIHVKGFKNHVEYLLILRKKL